jgi:hypothetical protein
MKVILYSQKMSEYLTQNKIYELIVSDLFGDNTITCKLSNYGWSLHREIIYYEFSIIDSSHINLIEGGVMILGINFDNKENTFNFFPYFNSDEHRFEQTIKKTFKAHIKLKIL